MALKDLASTTLAGSLLVQKHSPDYHGFLKRVHVALNRRLVGVEVPEVAQ